MQDALLNEGSIGTNDINTQEPLNAPEINYLPNPFSKYDVTSQPVQSTIGINNDDLSRNLNLSIEKSLKDPFIQAQRFETPAIPGYEAAKASPYFETIGVQPGMDIEETYGKAQTNWNKLSNAVFGSASLAWNQAKDQFMSWGDTLDMFKDRSFTAPFKQAELEAINTWQNDFNNKYHIFQTQEDRNTFFNMSNFANMVQQSGYAIGAILEIGAEEAALSALTAATFGGASEIQAARTLQLASRIGSVINKTREIEKSLQGTNILRKIFNNSLVKFINPIGDTAEFLTGIKNIARADRMVYGSTKAALRTTARGFGAFYRDMRMINAGITEAKATVAPVMTDAYNLAVDEYKKVNGVEPSEELKSKLKQKAFETVQTEGAVQALWITLTDRVAFDGVLKTFKATRFLDDGLVAKGIFTNTEKAIKAGENVFVAKTGFDAFTHQLKTSPIKTLLAAPIEYAKENLMEGIQESGQDVIDSATKQWYLYNYGTDEQRAGQKDFNNFLYAGAKEQLTMDGLKTFMSGFLTGGILNVLGSGIRGGRNLYEKTVNVDGYKSSVERADEERNKLVATLNDATNNKSNFYRSLVELDASMRESAKDGRKKDYWDSRNDFINKYVLSIVKSGVDDVVVDRMKEAIKDLTPEEFKQAYAGSIYDGMSEEQAKTTMNKLVDTFESKVKEVKDTYQNIRNNYGNPYNPQKYEIGTEDYNNELANYMAAEQAIDHISFSKGTYTDIAKRQVEILSSVKQYFPNLSFNLLYSVTSPSITLKKELEILQKEYEATADPALKEQKKSKIDLLTKYKTSVEKFNKQIQEANFDKEKVKKIKADFLKENSKVLLDILQTENPDSKIVTPADSINSALDGIFDYLQLQSDFEDSLSYFNIIANPGNFEGLHQAHLKEILNLFKKTKEEAEKETKDKKSIEIEVKDKEGKPHKITLVEGDEYITESNPTKRVMPKSGKVITTYDQDIIKINSLDLDNNTLTITINNSGESVTYTLDEFSELSGKLWNLSEMDKDAALFFRNRDRVIVIKVNKDNGLLHRIDGVHAKKDYSSNSQEVYAMIKYDIDTNDPSKTKKILYFDYKTKDGKSHRVPFDINYYNKYGVKTDQKYLLRVAPTVEEYLKQQSEKRKLDIYNKQIEIFELLIKEQEKKSGPREQRKLEINKQIDQINKDLDEAEEYVKLANKEINDIVSSKKKISQKQKREIASLKQLANEYTQKLNSLKETLSLLNAEKLEIENELKVLNEVSESYYLALDEIKKTETPYLRGGTSQTIYGEEQDKLNQIEQERPVSYVPVDDFERVLNSLNLEKNDIENKLKIVEDTIKRVEKLISRFTKYDDIINVIIGTDPTSNKSKKELQTALVKLKLKEQDKQEPDKEKIELINNLLSGLNTRLKGFDNQVFGKEILEAISFVNLFSIATQEKQKFQDQLNFVSKEIEDISEGKEYNDKNIIPLKQKIEYLKNIEKVLLEGQAKLEALNLIEKTKTSVKAPTTEAAEQFAGYDDIMSYEEVISLDGGKDDIILIDHDKVKFINALFKTAGRHYENSSAQKDNKALTPEQDRFFTFTSNSIIANQNYFLIPITEDNDKYGIIQKSYINEQGNTVEVKDDVKLIVAKKVAGKYIPVDKYGNVLPEDQQTKDNLVFNSMVNNVELMQDDVDAAIKWLKSDANKTFTITKNKIGANGIVTKEEYTDEELKNELNAFKKFRSNIIKNIKDGIGVDPLKVEKKSIGKQRREVLDVTTGRPQELELQGRLIEEDPDFSVRGELKHPDGNPIELRVSTKDSGISSTIKQGRMVMQKGDTFYQVYNRRINENEINNIFDVILTILPMFGRRNISKERIDKLKELYDQGVITLDRLTELTKKLSPEEEKQFDLGLRYLLHTIYWSQVKEGGKIGNKQFYIKGDSLYVGGKAYQFEIDGKINLQNIIDSKDEIMNIIERDSEDNIISQEPMFHAVNSGSIKKKDQQFITVKVVDGVIVKDKEYKNYLEYLLSNKDSRTPIVYTNIVKYNKDEPQLANSYLIYSRPHEETSVPPKPKEEESKTSTTIEEEIIEESLLELPLDLNNIPKNEKIVIRKKFGSTKKIVDFYGIWDGTKFVIEKAFNVTDNKDSTSIILEKVPSTITESINNVSEYKNSNDPELKKIYTDLLSDFISISKVTEQKKKIFKQDTSVIKSNIETLIRMGKIEYVDDTTNAKC